MARLASIALLAAVVAIAGCGSDATERHAYIRDLTAAQKRYQQRAERLEAETTATSTASQDRRTLARFSAVIEDTIATLRAIKPPASVTAEHAAFVDVFVTWHDDVERFARAIFSPTRSGLRRAQREIAAANEAFDASLRRAGTRIDSKLES